MSIKYASKLTTDIPTSLMVYKLASPQSANTAVAAMSQRFGLTGKLREFNTSEEWTAYSEGRFRIAVHRNSGAVRYTHQDKYGIEPEKDFKISKAESDKIAMSFLSRTKLFPAKDIRLHRVTHMLSVVSDLKGKEKIERKIDAGVIYRRYVDNIPVEGPGGYAMVNIDPESEVIGMRSVWRPTADRAGKVKIVKPDIVRAEFEKSLANIKGDITVKTASFGYFEQHEMDRQTYLEPAYVFIYTVQNGDVAHKSIEVLPAAEQTFARMIGKKRFPVDQTKRKGAK